MFEETYIKTMNIKLSYPSRFLVNSDSCSVDVFGNFLYLNKHDNILEFVLNNALLLQTMFIPYHVLLADA